MLRIVILLLIINNIVSCSLGGGPAPQDHFYRLPEVKLDGLSESSQVSYKNIVIKPVKATGLYHERAILFIESHKPLELQRYHYSFWSSTPAELTHNALYEGLRSSGIVTHVSRGLSELRPDYIIDTRIIQFERYIDNSAVNIQLALDISVRSGHTAGLTWTKRYKVSKTLDSTDMHASAEAFGEAFKEISTLLVNDLLNKK
ncbi:MAG: ABC-type transport auxiliary lipoprotein family protein [Gammaproteobacteria bacterium]|nr:ABC-type transport auxiliary lipoprotein family protein [Gammaproteobacteria bacterium]